MMKKLLAALLWALSALAFAVPLTPATGTITTQNLVAAGACTAGGCVEIDTVGMGAVTVQVAGTYTGALSGQVTTDGTNWVTMAPTPFAPFTAISTPTATIGSGATGIWQVSAIAGAKKFRVTGLAAMTGTATVTIQPVDIGSGGGSSGGGGGGDASAANQTTQISYESRLLSSASPKAPGAALATTAFQVAGTYNASGVTLTDTQEAGIQLDANGRQLVALPDVKTFTGTCAAACGSTTLASATTDGYSSIEVQVTSAGSGTLTFQCSSDNVTFSSCNGVSPSATGSGTVPQSTATTVGQTTFPIWARYFRVQVTSYTSGTFTVVGYLRSKPFTGPASSVNVANTLSLGAGQGAHDSAINGAPVRVGCRGRTSYYATTIVNDDTVDVQCDLNGAAIVKPYSVAGSDWTYAAASGGIVNTTTAVTIVGAAGASIRNYLTGCQINAEALGSATELAIRDGAAGTVLWRIKIGTGGIPSGLNLRFATPLRGTANTLMEVVTLTASVTGAVYVNCQGYQGQ